ncbi:MAG: formate/nitrite transporter family protein [Butyricicoccus sp.]
MFQKEFDALCQAAQNKHRLLQSNPLGYLVASMVAGMFISFGSFIAMSIGGICTESGCTITKFLVSLTFAAALSLVIMAGSELFTGNNLILGAAALRHQMKWSTVVGMWLFCWIGNLIGSWIMVLLFHFSGVLDNQAIAAFFASTAAAKTASAPVQLLIKGVLCNICVCLAVWCSFKLTSESGKLIMIVWCILIFMVCGFEHSIANMSIIGVGLLNAGEQTITLAGYCSNLLFVSLGNILGGLVFVAAPYALISQK